jgi:hypothetical protein
MPALSLKPLHELTERDFVEHSVWVAYYEPDELDDLERLGIDRHQAQRELGALDNPDQFVFHFLAKPRCCRSTTCTLAPT